MKAKDILLLIIKCSLLSAYLVSSFIIFTSLYVPLVNKLAVYVPHYNLEIVFKLLFFLLYAVGFYQPWALVEKKFKTVHK
jgi:hypothetical protein